MSTREGLLGAGVSWLATWSLRLILIVVAALGVLWVLGKAWVIVLPIFLALILATVLTPPARLLRDRARFPNTLAAAAVVLGAVAIVVGTLWALAPSIVDQSSDIATDASEGLTTVEDWLADGPLHVTDAQLSTAVDAAQARLQESATSIAGGVVTGVTAVTSLLITLLLVLVLTFFFVKDGARFTPFVRRVLGPQGGGHAEILLDRLWGALGRFIRTQAIVSLVDAVFIGLGLVVVGVPLAIPLAILTFFGGFIPIVGAVLVGVLAALVALVSNGVTGALIVVGIILLVQQLEGNVLSPWLQGRSSNLHAAVILLSVTLGSTLYGIVGAFLAVPVVAMLAEAFRYLSEVVDVEADDERDPAVDPRERDPGTGTDAGPVHDGVEAGDDPERAEDEPPTPPAGAPTPPTEAPG